MVLDDFVDGLLREPSLDTYAVSDADLALLQEQLGNDAEAIRIDEPLLAYLHKMGTPFAMNITSTRVELSRLRAKQ